MISWCRSLQSVTKRFVPILILTSSFLIFAVPAYCNDEAQSCKPVAKGTATATKPSSTAVRTAAGAKPTAAKRPRVVEMGAVWCAPCKIFAPIFARSKATYASKADFQSLDLDTPEGKAFANKYNVVGVPVVVILDGNGKAVFSHTGLMEEKNFNAEIVKVVH
jgi:thioredoxin 1